MSLQLLVVLFVILVRNLLTMERREGHSDGEKDTLAKTNGTIACGMVAGLWMEGALQRKKIYSPELSSPVSEGVFNPQAGGATTGREPGPKPGARTVVLALLNHMGVNTSMDYASAK